MPKMTSLEDLKKIREDARKEMHTRLETGTKISVGMGTCGIAAGARETMHAILQELEQREIEAHVATVGCIGKCADEPLVDIEQAGGDRITYGNVMPDMVSRLVEEHLINGRVVEDWVVGRLPKEGI
jgi:NADP-reducing hydrogenase subunit HndB